MTPQQIKEALLSDETFKRTGFQHEKSDCDLAHEIEESDSHFMDLMILWIMLSPVHNLGHLMITCCKLGYEYRKRESEITELNKYA